MILLEEFDPCKNAVIDADMCVKNKPDIYPEITISCFSHHLFEAVLAFFEPEEIARVGGANGKQPIYAVTYKGKHFAFFESRVGEPACIGDFEDMTVMGMRKLILFGNCGVLDRSIEDCGIIIPTEALRDEGSSYHYAPPADSMEVNHKYRDLFHLVLEEHGYPYVEGTTWTTDAPYRETREKPREPFVWRWSVPECRQRQIFGMWTFSSSCTPEIIWTKPPGIPAACPGKPVWMTKGKSPCWPLSWA